MRTGTVMGFPYQVHPAWLLLFAVLLVSVVTTVDSSGAAELSGAATLIVSAVVVVLFVGCIVAHEFSHALVARRLGLPRQRIQLLSLGRAVESEPDPPSPSIELKVAMAGPLLSTVIGGSLLIVASGIAAGGADLLPPL